MDFLRLIRSIEELLYEVVTWIVLYPRTLWRIVRAPVEATRFSEVEEQEAVAEQYTDALSPPLLLLLTILFAHGLEVGLGLPLPVGGSPLGDAIWSSTQNTLVLRALVFCLFPLTAATSLLARRGQAVDRRTLRSPFFSQCYLAAPFCLVISIGAQVVRLPHPAASAGPAVVLIGVLWYLAVETAWFARQLGVGRGRAALAAGASFLKATLLAAGVAAALFALG